MTKPRNPQHSPQHQGETSVAATPAPASRPRADWEAIEREYRTGRFSVQELSDKFGNVVSRQAIGQMARRKGWTKDLSAAVRLATSASLIQAQVQAHVTGTVSESCDKTLQVVLAAAEVNKQVILGHRGDIARLRKITMDQVDSLEAMIEKGAKADKPVDPGTVLLSVQRATQSLTRLQLAERKAFSLDEPDDPASADMNAVGPVLTNAQRTARVGTLVAMAAALQAAAEAGDAPQEASSA
jgi:hypothetical protein